MENNTLRNKNSRSKYDWEVIKFKFFESSYKEVKGFFEDIYGTYNGTIRCRTAGWAKEKCEWKDKTTKKALDQLQTNRAKSLASCFDHLIVEINRRVNNHDLITTMKVHDLRILWQLLRCENGLPDRITEHKNPPQQTDWGKVKESLLSKIAGENRK